MRRLLYIIYILIGLTACTDDFINSSDADIVFEEGEAVAFMTNVPVPQGSTRAYTLNETVLQSYSTVQQEYSLSIKMFEEGVSEAKGTCTYNPVVTPTGFNEDGLLEANPAAAESALCWETNQKKYAFEATAGTETLETDQSTKEKWLAQDKLHGYAYIPLMNEGVEVDNLNALNYHTNKEWGALNRQWRDLDAQSQMLSTEHYKYIPLFLQHQRSWITLKLKAGNGVSREALKFDQAQKNCQVSFYSYASGQTEPTVINSSWAQPDTVNYVKDKNGAAANGVETTCYNVIVEPSDYFNNADNEKIASINLSGLKFTFSARNDVNYEKATLATPDGTALAAMQAYNLNPSGKHLTITATLSTDRVIFITAWIEDWTTIATTTICDDYGQNGDPILINSRQDLIEFLGSEQNKSGNVAIIVANTLDLDKSIVTGKYTAEEAAAYNQAHKDDPGHVDKKAGDTKTTISDDPWSGHNQYTLNATLNLAGARFDTTSRFLQGISSSGSIINGTIVVDAEVPSAIAETNSGTLERITVLSGASGTAKASQAGLVNINHGTIYQCSSSLPVYGQNADDTYIYVGGIAAQSVSADGTTMPVIDGCSVLASVKGTDKVKGGGIVGLADGRITNNTFEYGITLMQEASDYKNIVADKTNDALRAENNWWPTLVTNEFDGATNTNANTTAQYDYVLDCQEELAELLKVQYDNVNNRYRKFRISNSFTVDSQTWNHGFKHDDVNATESDRKGNLQCELDGNNKTITLSGTKKVLIPTAIDSQGKATATVEKETCAMLFSNITGSVHDLTIQLEKPLIATPETNASGILTATDAIAPLAYAVTGPDAIIKNIQVKMADDAYIQAALPAGVVCWAYNGATVEACQAKGKILSWIPTTSTSVDESGQTVSDARRYAGGIVGLAARATIKDCIFHTEAETLKPANTNNAQIYYGGILGGTTTKTLTTGKEDPAVSIVDCTSWFTPAGERKGAILGYAIYYDVNNKPQNGTVIDGSQKCQGNWWNTTSKGVAKVVDGQTVEGVIGTCNNYTPTKDNTY